MSEKDADTLLRELLDTPQDARDRALAARYAPILRFDAHEPFFPLAAGYTIFRESGPAPSFRQGHQIDLAPEGEPPAGLAIEYAIWWDWDIGHLYELEHVWVYVDPAGRVVRGEASWHGGLHDMRHQGRLALDGDHLVVFSEPGKHAFAPTPEWFHERARRFKRSETRDLAGISGVLVTRFAAGQVTPSPLDQRLVQTYLAQHAFEPSGQFDHHFLLASEMLIPWTALEQWIPKRLNHCLKELAAEIPPHEYRFLRIASQGAILDPLGDLTEAGLRQAAETGADIVVLELHRTLDHHLVLAHKGNLYDEGEVEWPTRYFTLEQLEGLDLGDGVHILTLTQALERCRQEQIGVYLDLQDIGALPDLVALTHSGHLGDDLASYGIIGSFRPDWLADCKALMPQIATAIQFASRHLDAVQLAQSIGASYLHPRWERYPDPSAFLTPAWIRRAREAGLGILSWPEDRPKQLAALSRLGLDGICSDAPELLLKPYVTRSGDRP